MHRVLVAPDKFKGTLTAREVADVVSRGLRDVVPDVAITCLPVADGGDGTVDAALAAGFTRVPMTALGPTGRRHTTGYARSGGTVVIELADVCGLTQLPDGARDPMRASSFGLGQVVAAALDAGARRIVLGIGGSASTDGGAGLLQALGARITDRDGTELPPGYPGAAVECDLSGLHPGLRAVDLDVASDVDNPLVGPDGAAAVYGPQKGATPAQVEELEEALRRWAELIARTTGADHAGDKGAGAAGGVGFAALVLGATLRPGIELVLDLLGFADALGQADLVITGEGSLDEQTLSGKAPVGVAAAAGRSGIPTVAVAGRCTLRREQLSAAGIRAVYPLTDQDPDEVRCRADAADLLRRAAAALARDWLSA